MRLMLNKKHVGCFMGEKKKSRNAYTFSIKFKSFEYN